MSLKNPQGVAYPASRTGIDWVIENIQTAMAGIPWISSAHTRAWNIPELRDGVPYRNPRIFSGQTGASGEYWNTLYNDEQTALSFCIAVGPAIPTEELEPTQIPVYWEKRLDLIVLGNYKKIDASKNYPFSEELAEQVIKALGKTPSVTYANVWTDDIRDVLDGFDLSEIERDFLYYPAFGLRFELLVTYRVDTGSPSNGIICE
jgi:hypothetical protein